MADNSSSVEDTSVSQSFSPEKPSKRPVNDIDMSNTIGGRIEEEDEHLE